MSARIPPLPWKFKAALLAGSILVGAFAHVVVAGEHGVLHLWHLQSGLQDLTRMAFDQQQRNERQRRHIDRLLHDDAYLERIARERYGLAAPGEIVYRVNAPAGLVAVDSSPADRPPTPPTPPTPPARRAPR